MSDTLSSLSTQLADATEQGAASVVQLHARRRPVAGVVFAEDLIIAPAQSVDDDGVVVRRADGHTVEGVVLGRSSSTGLAVVRAEGLGVPAIVTAAEPRVGSLALAVGRTWSGGVFATLASIAVVGGPLRTGRTSEIARVIRIAQAPHGALNGGALVDATGKALGVITAMAIRGTTVVIPASLAIAAAQEVVAQGGARQGFIGISSTAVSLPSRQRAGRAQEHGLLVTGLVEGSPADAGGLLVGDVIVGFEQSTVQEPEQLLTLLRGDHVGRAVTLTMIRGGVLHTAAVTVGERRQG